MADPDFLLAHAPVEIQAAEGDAKPATVSIAAYNGGIMAVGGYGPVVIDLAGLDVSASVALLADHDASIDGVIGTGKAKIAANALSVSGTIERETDNGRKIITLARGGFPFQASVGVRPSRFEFVASDMSVQVNGRTIIAPPGGFRLVRAGKLREVSILALGADDSTSVSITAKGNAAMDPANITNPNTPPGNVTAGETDHDRGRNEERARIRDIDRICAGATFDVSDIRAQAIDGTLSVADLSTHVLARLRSDRGHGGNVGGAIRAADLPQGKVLEAVLLVRAGYGEFAEKQFGDRIMQAADDLRVTSMVDLCAAALRVEGREAPRDRNEMIRAAFSTMSLPTALGNAANKTLLAVYNESPSTWESFAAVKPASNFKDQKSIRPSMLGELQEIGPDGELKHAGIDEAVFDWFIDTYGTTLGITRTHIINDDLGIFDEVLPGMARMSKRKLSDLVWGKIIANTGSHYSGGNGNLLTGAGSALSVAGVGAAIAAMRTQRTADGTDLDIRPRSLVVPPELEHEGKSVLESEFLQRIADQTAGIDRQPTGNPVRQSLKLEVEPRLSNDTKFSGTSAASWYLFAGPIDVPAIVGFLDGRRAPTTEFFGYNADPNKLGVQYRVYHDFGFALGDPKASNRNAGS